MGYTHYWTIHKPFTDAEWAKIQAFATLAFSHAYDKGIKICEEHNKPNKPAVADEKEIRFNGVGDKGHETFVLERCRSDSFCKTARKPYDTVVCAILIAARVFSGHYGQRPKTITIYSDGRPVDDSDWDEAISFFNEITQVIQCCPQASAEQVTGLLDEIEIGGKLASTKAWENAFTTLRPPPPPDTDEARAERRRAARAALRA